MDLTKLEAFVCVMECRSFSQAAARMYVSQPTVSAHVAALERELGVKLIIRTTKEIYPSEAGNILYDYAQRMLKLRRDAVEAIRSYACDMSGYVTVAASSIPVREVLPGLLKSFRARYPKIDVELHEVDSKEAVAQVVEREAEVGFCGTRMRAAKCVFEEIGEDKLVMIAPDIPKYKKYQRIGFPVRLLERERFISREKGSGTRREMEAFLKEMGVDAGKLQIVAQSDSNEQIKEWVREEKGVAVLSQSVLDDPAGDAGLLSFDFNSTRLRRKLFILRHKTSDLSPAAQTFYTYAKAYGSQKKIND
ncbi:MAG: selenium metabolism-associated LysR family transcriptional regulator [Eubacteriales bacterium]|nr:selenium metabolism-associated LysR family transcriptional regulator [Eubacteriales bacterium]